MNNSKNKKEKDTEFIIDPIVGIANFAKEIMKLKPEGECLILEDGTKITDSLVIAQKMAKYILRNVERCNKEEAEE